VAQQMADRLALALRAVADAQEVIAEENGRGTVRLIRSGEVSEVGTRK
jgi:pilus assembly protein CpaB